MSQPSVCLDCSYNFYKDAAIDRISCSSGDGSCFYAELLSPLQTVEKAFHDTNLRGATTAINNILNNLRPNAPDGLQLCFLRLPDGIMLAWVEQDGPIVGEAITSDSDPDEIRLAAGLIDPGYQAA
jgi:hypothetical protein